MSTTHAANGDVASAATHLQEVFDRMCVGSSLPLARLSVALRAAGIRLMQEDVDDIEAAAEPYAPLSREHFKHFHTQAVSRHSADDEVHSALSALVASPPTVEELRAILTEEQTGDALSDTEWKAYLDTLGPDHASKKVRAADLM